MNKILVLNIATDSDDTSLGFAITWLNSLSKNYDEVDVITLKKGNISSLNENINIFIKKLNDPYAKTVSRFPQTRKLRIEHLAQNTIYIHFPTVISENVNQFNHVLNRKRLFSHVIIDFRNTSGGDIDSGAEFTNLFLNKDALMFHFKRLKNSLSYRATTPASFSGQVSVLVNKNTASVAEVITASLQHHINATVIGQNSRGKVAVQKQFIIDKNNYLYLTVGYLIPPSGEDYYLNGITPNIYLKPAPINFTQIKDDLAVKTALKLANKAKNR
mgnify:CR=1 FL=1